MGGDLPVGEGGVECGVGREKDEEAIGDEAAAVDQDAPEFIEVLLALPAPVRAIQRTSRRPLAHHRRQHLPGCLRSGQPPLDPCTTRGSAGPWDPMGQGSLGTRICLDSRTN